MLTAMTHFFSRLVEIWRDWRSKADGTEVTDVYPAHAADSPQVTGNEFHAAFHTEAGFL